MLITLEIVPTVNQVLNSSMVKPVQEPVQTHVLKDSMSRMDNVLRELLRTANSTPMTVNVNFVRPITQLQLMENYVKELQRKYVHRTQISSNT